MFLADKESLAVDYMDLDLDIHDGESDGEQDDIYISEDTRTDGSDGNCFGCCFSTACYMFEMSTLVLFRTVISAHTRA